MASMERPVGLTRDTGWEIGVSRTLPYPRELVWDFLTSTDGLALWLGTGARLGEPGEEYVTTDGTTGELRSFRPHDRMRLTWQARGWSRESTVQVAIRPGGSSAQPRTTVRFHQEQLNSAEERDGQRAHWTAVMDDLTAALAASNETRSTES